MNVLHIVAFWGFQLSTSIAEPIPSQPNALTTIYRLRWQAHKIRKPRSFKLGFPFLPLPHLQNAD